MNKLITLLFVLFYSAVASAEFFYMGRSQEGLLMGDAYTAVADDENTLFYNPAALGRHNGVSIYAINPSLEVPNVIDIDLSLDNFNVGLDDSLKNFPKEPELIVDRILGIPLYLKMGISPTVKMQNFAFSLFAINKTTAVLENAIHPTLDLSYRYDKGFMFGYALNFGRGGNNRKKTGNQGSLGIGIKRVTRNSLEGNFDLFGTRLLQIISNSDSYKQIREGLGYNGGSGWGFDLGLEHNYYKGPTRFGFGASLLDIGDTKFSREEGTTDIPVQEMSLNLGSAFEQDFSWFKYTIALDLHNAIDARSEFGSKLHFGVRAKTPIVGGYLGWNGGYGSIGLSLDAFFMRLTVGLYGIEAGSTFKEKEAKRAVFSLNLLPIELNTF